MANGIQRTPFDTIDLGSQLLESLVAAQRTKDEKERFKLQEKQLGLQEKAQQLEALKLANPMAEGFGQVLSSLVGAPVQPQVSPQQQEFAQLQDYLKANPDVKDMYMRLQTTGTPLQTGEAVEGARIAAGLKAGFKDRAAMVGQLLEQMGSPATSVWNRAIGREIGVQAPTGVKTLPERAVGAEEKRAKATGATEEAARIRARQDAVEFIAGGFQPLPNSPAAQDPALARKYAEELTDYAMGRQNVVSPEAITQMVPLSKWGAILKASAEPSPEFQKRLVVARELLDYVNKQKGKVPKETLEQVQTLLQSLYDEALPPAPEGEQTAEAPGFFSSAISSMLGILTSGPGDVSQVSLSGRPLKPEVQDVLNKVTRAGKYAVGQATGVGALEGTLKLLNDAYNKVLPLITTAAPGEVSGLLERGNIDLYNRPSVPNPQGGTSTVYSTSFNIGGKEVLVPRVSEDGKRILSPQEALEQYKQTGKHLGIFDTAENATKYAQQLHNDYAAGKFGTGRTFGALSGPEASQFSPEQKQKLQGLVAAYRAASGSPEEAAAIESELIQVMKSGDVKAQQEYIQALLDDIKALKETGQLEPRQ